MRNQKGITLVALVITIIVLLILAGVSISLVVGQNGVLNQASNAVVTNKAAAVKEKVSTALASAENTSTTRATVYADTTNGVAAQLKANYGDTNVTVGELFTTPSTANVTITDGSDTFKFKVSVDANGKATFAEEIEVLVGGTKSTTVKLK